MIVKTCRKIAEDIRFHRTILILILLSALLMGLETSQDLMASHGTLLHALDRLVQAIFVLEITLRLTAFWPAPVHFFRDGWNTFDFLVVALSLLPMVGPFAVVARSARVLRVARLASHSRELKLIIGTMLRSIPSLGHVAVLLGLFLYVYGVIGCHLYGTDDPARWGSLPLAFETLFQILTLEGWVDIQQAVIVQHPLAWLLFASYVIMAGFVVVNLFIAVVLNNLQAVQAELDRMERQEARPRKRKK